MDLSQSTLWQEALEACGAIEKDIHMESSHGRHLREYANLVPARVPRAIRRGMVRALGVKVKKWLAADFGNCRRKDIVVLATGCGSYYAYTFADEIGALFVYAQEEAGTLRLKRQQGDLLRGKPVILFDDVVTTSKTLSKLGTLALSWGGLLQIDGLPVPAVTLLDRGGTAKIRVQPPNKAGSRSKRKPKLLQLDLVRLMNVKLKSWSRTTCPMCKRGIPISRRIEAGQLLFARTGNVA